VPKKKVSHVNHKIVLQLLNRCSQISILIEFTYLIYIFNMYYNTFLFEKYLVIRFYNKHKILYLHIDYIFNLHNFKNKC